MNIDLIVRGNKFFSLYDIKPWIGSTKVHYLVAGSIGYISLNLKLLGNEVHVISCISNDYFGKFILSEFKKRSIDINYIKIEKDKSSGIGIYLPLIENQKRPFSYQFPTHNGWPLRLQQNLIDFVLDSQILHCGGYLHFSNLWNDNIVYLFKKAKEKGLITSLDPQFPINNLDTPWLKALKALIPYIDILLLDESEAMGLTATNSFKVAANNLIKNGFSKVIIKLAEKGVLYQEKKISTIFPAIKPKKIVDYIGSGDAFDAGFIHGIIKGKTYEKAVKLGIITATKSIEQLGGLLTLSKIEEINKETPLF